MSRIPNVIWAARNLFARPKSEPWSAEDEQRWQRELDEESGPIGREDTVWGHGPGVRPGDEGVWEWFGWDAPDELEAWSEEIRAAMPRLPADSLLFDLDAGLRTADFESLRSTDFRGVVKEFHHDVASAFRRMTSADEWIYAIDEPRGWLRPVLPLLAAPRDREHKVVRVADPGRR